MAGEGAEFIRYTANQIYLRHYARHLGVGLLSRGRDAPLDPACRALPHEKGARQGGEDDVRKASEEGGATKKRE